MIELRDLVDQLHAKKSGVGYISKCPAHDDASPSLSITEKGEKILLFCHAGCSVEDICGQLGIELSDLFPDRGNGRGRSERIAATYDYRDPSGTLRHQTVRYDPKRFTQRRPDGRGGFIWDLKCDRFLYRLPELLAADPSATVFIVEGEKDADRLASLGLVATTNPMGAGKWREEYNKYLQGRPVAVLTDRDKPNNGKRAGYEHGQQVAKSLFGTAASIKVVELPGLPGDGGDVSDWLNQGNDAERLCIIVEEAPEWEPKLADDSKQLNVESEPEPLLRVLVMSAVEVKPIDWLWAGRIPRGAITIIEGAEGEGKSTLITAITAAITKGYALPGDQEREPGAVLWCSAEDDLARVLRPRLEAAGADLSLVHAIADPFRLDDRHIVELRAQIERINPVFVVLDPVFAYTIGDSNKGGDSRSTTNPLKLAAEQFQCSMGLVRHIGKAKGLGDPRAAGLYSIEWRAAARSVLLVGSDPNDKSRRAVTQNKSNYGPISASIGYAIDSDGSSPSGARFYWTGESTLTSAAILASLESEDSKSSRRVAEQFLLERLADGPMPEKEIAKDSRTAGITASTLRRAKEALGIKSRHYGQPGEGQEWRWSLPERDDPEDAHPFQDAHTL